MATRTQKQAQFYPQDQCCICGTNNCVQSTDHSFININTLKRHLGNYKNPNHQLDALKQQVRLFYQSLRSKVVEIMIQDEAMIQQHLNKYYFPHLNSTTINISHLSSLIEGDFTSLPSKKVNKILRQLQRQKNHNQLEREINTGFTETEQEMQKYIKEFQNQSFLQKFKDHLPYSCVVEKYMPQLKLRKSTSQISNPEEIDEQVAKVYNWKNITLKSNTKVLQLSNKGITDKDLIKQLPKISSFKNVKDFQIRNNKFTAFSCRLIASNMIHVKSVDIRGNKVGDQGVIAIVKGIPHLTSFMISETGCTNASAKQIVKTLKGLQMFWCEHNRVDACHALQIANMEKLRVLSFAGNGIDSENAEKLKKVFNPKGYIVV